MVEEHLNPHIFSIYLHGFFFTSSRKNGQEDVYLAKESYKEDGEGNKGGREGGRPTCPAAGEHTGGDRGPAAGGVRGQLGEGRGESHKASSALREVVSCTH